MEKKETVKIGSNAVWGIVGGITFIGLVIVAVNYFKKGKKPNNFFNNKASRGGNSSSTTPNKFCKRGDAFPLQYGSCGENVRKVQRKLKALGIDIGNYGSNKDGVDGKFGNATIKGLKKAFKKTSITSLSSTDANKLNTITRVV